MAPGSDVVRPTRPANVLFRTTTGVDISLDPSCGPRDEPEILPTSQRRVLSDAIAEAEHTSGLRFATFLGDLGADPRASAEDLLATFGDDAPYTVLVAISPGQRVTEIVTGTEAALRTSDRACRVAVLAITSACSEGDIAGALLGAVRVLADHAGAIPARVGW